MLFVCGFWKEQVGGFESVVGRLGRFFNGLQFGGVIYSTSVVLPVLIATASQHKQSM